MPKVKRESSSTPSLDSDLMKTPPSTPKKAKDSPKKSSPNKPKYVKQSWTIEEDLIFIELIEEVLKESLYPKIKLDGRLQRESPAVRAHLNAVMNKLKKSQ